MGAIVADLGGTFLRCAVATGALELAGMQSTRLAGKADTRDANVWTTIVEGLAAYANEHAQRSTPSDPLVLAFPGPIGPSGSPQSAPTIWGEGRPIPDLRAMLAERTGRHVAIVNDVSAAAWYFSARLPVSRFFVVTISSGIGAKLFDAKRDAPVLDDVAHGGEIGHIVVDRRADAPLCDCGGRGHLGAIASGRGAENLARARALADPHAFATSYCVCELGATLATLSNEAHLVPAARVRDPWTTAVVRDAAEPLARVLAAVVVATGLERVALMGGFAQQIGAPYLEALQAAFGAYLDRGTAWFDARDLFVLAGPAEQPSLMGAAIYARSLMRSLA